MDCPSAVTSKDSGTGVLGFSPTPSQIWRGDFSGLANEEVSVSSRRCGVIHWSAGPASKGRNVVSQRTVPKARTGDPDRVLNLVWGVFGNADRDSMEGFAR